MTTTIYCCRKTVRQAAGVQQNPAARRCAAAVRDPSGSNKKMLDIARQYGFNPEGTCIGELFAGTGAMTQVFQKEAYKFIARDKFSMSAEDADFYTNPLPDGVNLILTNPPFRGKARFFERIAELGEFLKYILSLK